MQDDPTLDVNLTRALDESKRLADSIKPGSDRWEDISWDDAIAGIAKHVKDTRDHTFRDKNAKGETVNRTPGIAWIGGCTDTNEFNFLQWKALTSWGVPYRDTQARV